VTAGAWCGQEIVDGPARFFEADPYHWFTNSKVATADEGATSSLATSATSSLEMNACHIKSWDECREG